MSELKAISSGEIYNIIEYEDCFRTDDLYYPKSEADKVIAELKAQKAQAEDDCAYWKMREGNAVNAMHETEEACMFLTKSERHQKYKRCLAMAKLCRSIWCANIFIHEGKDSVSNHYMRWEYRWKKLAERFKEETK